jgi:hypothetical protein
MRNAWLCVAGLLAALLLGGCGAPVEDSEASPVGKVQEPLINGADNRTDIADTSDWSNWDRPASIAAVMASSLVNIPAPYPPPPNPPYPPVTFNAPTLKVAHNLCDGQCFENQLTPVNCTAVLIDDDLVLTNAGCVTTATCADTRFIFDYWRHHDGSPEANDLHHAFKCQSVVVSQTTPANFAIVRLDRSARNAQQPAPIRRSRAPLAQGLTLFALGHLHGTSAKYSPGGIVLNQGSPGDATFELSNDGTVMGAKGSGIFLQETGELVGIWTDPSHGEADYEPGPPGSSPPGCNVVKTCPESGCGTTRSTATYVGPALDAYCASNTNPRLCQPRNSVDFTAAGSPYHLASSVYLEPGATIDYGTCITPGGSFVGDTTIALRGPYWDNYAINDDGGGSCGFGSHATYTSPPLMGGRYSIRPGCYQEGVCSGTVAYTVSGPTGGSYSYTANATQSATQSTRNFTISVRRGETLIIGTCGVEHANFTGDTMIVLKSGSTTLATADDSCGGSGSRIVYTPPSAQTLTLQAGCFGQTACSGTVAWTKGTTNVLFSATNTNNGAQNTVNQTVRLVAGDRVTVGTCGVPGASYAGDSVVSLFLGSTRVAFNDNDCAGLGSRFVYRVTTTGDYSVRVGCSLGTSCSGNAVVRVTPPDSFTGSISYSMSQTNNATDHFRPLFLTFRAGDLFSAATCPTLLPGGSGTGDTYLRLDGPDGLVTWASDDNCPGGSSALSGRTDLLITPEKAGNYLLRNGCYGLTACTGNTAYKLQ